ncbi:MAG: tetratricopeptide repeat protein [Bacteroidales bacterium]|nr:tetratricopeptide repeat protein [Bacteroidales bacterium]
MKRLIYFVVLCTLCLVLPANALAQSADRLYEQGKELYDKKQYKEAIPKLRAAAEKGHKKAQYRLGKCYDKGYGIEEDDQLAFQWYKKSSDQGYHKGQYELGRCYRKGKGVPKDNKKAFELFTLSAKQDNGEAQLALGECYMKGKGTTADAAKAKYWFNKAIRNEKKGKEILADLRKSRDAGDEDAKKILEIVGKK